MVYVFEFNVPDVTGVPEGNALDLRFDVDSDRFWVVENLINGPAFRAAIDALLVLGTLNRAVRKEARATFWAMASFTLRADGVYAKKEETLQAAHMFAVTKRFLASIGDDGRFGLKRLVVLEGAYGLV